MNHPMPEAMSKDWGTLQTRIENRFGVLPNFYRIDSGSPAVVESLWDFARFAYLDNPLPSLFKERLFVYLSRIRKVSYCIARHAGFLAGRGYPSGDDRCPIQTIDEIVRLLRRPFPRAEHLEPHLSTLAAYQAPLAELPGPDSVLEETIFACATHVFLQTPDAPRCLDALKRAFGKSRFENLMAFLAYAHTAHYWASVHTELEVEEDIRQLLATSEALAECLHDEPEAGTHEIGRLTDETDIHDFRRLLDALPVAVYTCNADGLISYFNEKAVEVWGRAPKLNDPLDRFCGSYRLYSSDGALIPLDKCGMALAIKENKVYKGCEIVIERPDGSRMTGLAHANPVYNEAGKLIGAVSMMVDIANLKRAEAAMAQMAAIVESSDDAIISKDLNGIITSWNKGAEKLFGYAATEVIGKSVTIIIPADRADEEPLILERIRRGDKVDHYETLRRRKDGSKIDISLTVSPIREKTGKVIGASKIARDITERRRNEIEREELLLKETAAHAEAEAARAEAEAANLSKDEFLATVSHELRSPLSAILGYNSMLGENPSDTARLKSYCEIIERNAKTQLQLIEDLLDTARIVSGKMRLELRPLDINPLLADALDVVRPAANAKGVQLRMAERNETGRTREAVLLGDPGRLQQIIWNLLSNAVKFTPAGGSVELSVECDEGHIQIIVSDTGKGIQPEVLPHIFERFRQADSSGSKRHGGLGLGLALVKHLVELHGGKVEAVSEGEGLGSTFTVTLPLAENTTQTKNDDTNENL